MRVLFVLTGRVTPGVTLAGVMEDYNQTSLKAISVSESARFHSSGISFEDHGALRKGWHSRSQTKLFAQ